LTYLVINLLTEERGVFETPRDVATYMWGRDFAQYAIYVCRRFPWLDGDLHAFEQALEAL
jgi:hypothetical protein